MSAILRRWRFAFYLTFSTRYVRFGRWILVRLLVANARLTWQNARLQARLELDS